MIEARQLGRSFGGHAALVDVSFSVEAGAVVGLLGPNGAGKTTCLRVLATLLAPSSGAARVAGHDVAREPLQVRRRCGYLPEGAPLYPELRVEEYLRFRCRLKGVARAARTAELARVLELCRIGDVRRRLIGQLSRGYRQRVGLADALLGAPPLLLLDEPLTGLDPNQTREMLAVLRDARAQQTVLLSSHVLAQVEAACSRLLVLHHGRLVAQGTPEALRGGSGELCAVVRGPAAAVVARLAALPGVEEVAAEILDADAPLVRCRIRVTAADDPGERIAAAISVAGWGLQELTRPRPALDDVFARLTGAGEER